MIYTKITPRIEHCLLVAYPVQSHNVIWGAWHDELDRYSRKHVCTTEQRSYDMHWRYNTSYSQNVSQAIIIS